MGTNTVRQHFGVTGDMRCNLHRHSAFLIWFTGLSGSGKSTIANAVELALHENGVSTYLLDGDNIRQGLNKDLSFTLDDRTENIRRIAEVAHLMIDAGVVVLASFIAPYRENRESVRKIVGADNYVEVYISTPLSVCEDRDVKGLYKKARSGEISHFTGISSPYEAPLNPDLTINTESTSLETSVQMIMDYIAPKLKRA